MTRKFSLAEQAALKASDVRKLKGAAELFRKAAAAREDPCAFLEFVMREETNQERIVAAPHQRVILDFVMAHPRCVLRIPADHGKTYTLNALTLFLLGQNTSFRGALIGAEQNIPAKSLKVARDYIESSLELRLVYPHLRKSDRYGDPWTQSALTIDRPRGIKDPSLSAVGFGGSIQGSRVNWAVVDDFLNFENTSTHESRLKYLKWLNNSVLSRLLPGPDTRCVFSNTAWHPKDAGHVLTQMGWPTLVMDILGGIDIFNADDWDHPLLRPEAPGSVRCRLVDSDDGDPLWAQRYDHPDIQKLRDTMLPSEFNRVYMNLCRDDSTSPCKQEYIDTCKELGRGLTLVSSYDGDEPTYTGVDLAVSPGEENDDVSLFTFAIEKTGHRRILDIEAGQWPGPVIVEKIKQKHAAYGSIVTVENNGAQAFIRQFVLNDDVSVPVRAYTTGRSKAHPEHGVQGLFVQLSNGAWRIPCDRKGRVHPAVERFINECLYYAPAKHTGDVLMSCFFAAEQAKKFGAKLPLRPKAPGAPTRAMLKRPGQGAIGASILAR